MPVMGTSTEVVNVPGQCGSAAAVQLAKASADGRHLFTADNGILVHNKELFKSLPHNPEMGSPRLVSLHVPRWSSRCCPMRRSRASKVCSNCQRMSGPDWNMPTPASAARTHLAMEPIKRKIGLQATHKPYSGRGLAMSDMIAGKVPPLVVDVAGGMKTIRERLGKSLLTVLGQHEPETHLQDGGWEPVTGCSVHGCLHGRRRFANWA